jgi:hypothetical protein
MFCSQFREFLDGLGLASRPSPDGVDCPKLLGSVINRARLRILYLYLLRL